MAILVERSAETGKSSPPEEVIDKKIFLKTSQKIFKGASAIHGMGHWVPETNLTTLEIENSFTSIPGNMLEIERKTGMKEKRVYRGTESVINFALNAFEELKKNGTFYKSEIPVNEIDLIIYFGVTREYSEPATAVVIQKAIGLNGPMAFDISNACLGFTDALCIADSMIADNRIRYALLISAEKLSIMGDRAIDHINDGGGVPEEFAALTLSDGAVAVLVGPQSDNKNIVNFRAGLRETHSEYGDLCILKNFSSRVISYPKEMFEAVLAILPAMVDSVLEYTGWTREDVYKVIPHQPSNAVIIKGALATKLPMDKILLTFPEFGNIASVSLPLSLSMLMEKDKDMGARKMMTFGFGSGLGFGILAFEVN